MRLQGTTFQKPHLPPDTDKGGTDPSLDVPAVGPRDARPTEEGTAC